MMPAILAVWSGSPFLTAPARIWRTASRDIVIRPRATASRAVAALSLTSTILTVPPAPTWDSVARRGRGWRDGFARLAIDVTLCEKEGQAFQRNGQVHALQLHVGRHLQGPGGKVQNRSDTRRDDGGRDRLCGAGGHGNHGDADAFAPNQPAKVPDVVDRHPRARSAADLLSHRIEERRDFEAFLAEARVIG